MPAVCPPTLLTMFISMCDYVVKATEVRVFLFVLNVSRLLIALTSNAFIHNALTAKSRQKQEGETETFFHSHCMEEGAPK